jgi:hypothetical protein
MYCQNRIILKNKSILKIMSSMKTQKSFDKQDKQFLQFKYNLIPPLLRKPSMQGT